MSSNGRMKASILYGDFAQRHPDDADAQNNYGVVQANSHDDAGAAVGFAKAITADPKNGDAHNNLGLALLHRWKLEEAIKEVQERLNLKAEYPEAQFHIGQALARQ